MYSDKCFTDYNVTKKTNIIFASKQHCVVRIMLYERQFSLYIKSLSRGKCFDPKYLGFFYGHIVLLSYIKHFSKNILFILIFYCIYLYCI